MKVLLGGPQTLPTKLRIWWGDLNTWWKWKRSSVARNQGKRESGEGFPRTRSDSSGEENDEVSVFSNFETPFSKEEFEMMYLGRGGYLDPSFCGHFVDHLGGLDVEAYRVDGPFTEMELGSGRSMNSPPDPFKSSGPEAFSPSAALAMRGIGLLSPFSTPRLRQRWNRTPPTTNNLERVQRRFALLSWLLPQRSNGLLLLGETIHIEEDVRGFRPCKAAPWVRDWCSTAQIRTHMAQRGTLISRGKRRFVDLL